MRPSHRFFLTRRAGRLMLAHVISAPQNQLSAFYTAFIAGCDTMGVELVFFQEAFLDSYFLLRPEGSWVSTGRFTTKCINRDKREWSSDQEMRTSTRYERSGQYDYFVPSVLGYEKKVGGQ